MLGRWWVAALVAIVAAPSAVALPDDVCVQPPDVYPYRCDQKPQSALCDLNGCAASTVCVDLGIERTCVEVWLPRPPATPDPEVDRSGDLRPLP